MKKTLVMGLGLMVGGAVLVLALAKQPAPTASVVSLPSENARDPKVNVLNADVATELKILQIKNQERERAVKQSDEQVKALLAAQEAAKELAIQKANSDKPVTDLVVQTRPEALALAQEESSAPPNPQALPTTAPQKQQATTPQKQQHEHVKPHKIEQKKQQETEPPQDKKQKQQDGSRTHTIQAGDTLIGLSRRYNVPVSVLAQANNMGRADALPRGKTLKIPSQKQAEQLKEEAKQRQQSEQQQKAADERLRQARQSAKRKGVNEHYAVQVALSSSQESADRLVKKYQQAGYQARTKKDDKGIRVVISERSREAALALKDKINHDPNVDSHGAWVLQLQP